MKARTVALAAEELRRAGFRCFVCPVTKRRRLYTRRTGMAINVSVIECAIIRTREGWFVGPPFKHVFHDEYTPTPVGELVRFKTWRAALACYNVTAGVQ